MRRRLFISVALVLAVIGTTEPAHAAEPVDEVAVEFVMRNDGVDRAEAIRRLAAQESYLALADRLTRELGTRSAGSWVDRRTGELVANVLDGAAADTARAAGARPQIVRYTASDLEAHRARLDRVAQEEGTGEVDSWYVDIQANRLVATVPTGADDAATRRFLDHVRAAGPMASIEPSAGEPVPLAANVYAGGTKTNSNGMLCSSGFAAKDAVGLQYMITAAHCMWQDVNMYIGNLHFGQRSYVNGSYDEAAVVNWYPAYWQQKASVWNYSGGFAQAVFGVWAAPVNTVACKSGTTTGYTCGLIQQYNVPAKLNTYPGGQQLWVFGLTKSSICSKPGDSGGPIVVSNWAQGTLSSGLLYTSTGAKYNGVGIPYCGSQVGKPTAMYYQPIGATLARAGLTIMV